MSKLIAITGGIGSGKSVVSQILRSLGYPVYDCDLRAKQIMDADLDIHKRICEEIHQHAVVGGKIDRQLIAQIVFNDKCALDRLNKIVHRAVLADLIEWVADRSTIYNYIYVETAIPIESGIVEAVDSIWQIQAPDAIRIARVEKRNNLTRAQVEARIASQQNEIITQESPHYYKTHTIINDNITPLLPQIKSLL